MHYAGPGPHAIWLGHYEPNDHVLFEFLAWPTARLLGRSEAAYRLWSVLPAIAAIGVVTWWLWRRWSRWLAVVFACLAVTSPMHLDLSKQARGYGLGFLAGALLLISALSIAGQRDGPRARPSSADSRSSLALAAGGLIGTWTLTGFAFAFVGQIAALLPIRRARRAVIAAAAVWLVGTLAFYAPLLGPIVHRLLHPGGAFHADVGHPLAWDSFLLGPPDQFLGPTFNDLLGWHARAAWELSGVALAAAGAVSLWRSYQRLVLLALAGPLIFTEVALTVLGVNLNPRYVSFLLFHFLLLVALGLLALARLAGQIRVARPLVPVAAAALIVALSVLLVRLADHWDVVPIENFKTVAAIVRRAGFAGVVTDSLRPRGLNFYLGSSHVRVLAPEQLESLFCHSRAPLAYVDHLAFAEVRYAGDPVRPMPVSTDCLQARHARLLTVRERDRGLPVQVWLLRPGISPAQRS